MFVSLLKLITSYHHHRLNYVYGFQFNISKRCSEARQYNKVQSTQTVKKRARNLKEYMACLKQNAVFLTDFAKK